MRIIPPILILLLITSSWIPSAESQPTWNLRITIYESELYMGEWGIIRANITNLDCNDRSSFQVELGTIDEGELEAITRRAEEMMAEKYIKNYTVILPGESYAGFTPGEGYGLYVQGACVGREIGLVGAGIWFPWTGVRRLSMVWRDVGAVLKAFNPINYIVEGRDPQSSALIEYKVFIPPDIPPEERELKPRIDVRLSFPEWLEYTLEDYPIEENLAEVLPYRSFNLTITGFDGVHPLAGAKVVIRRLVRYFEVREYTTPENGTIRIWRLPEDKYEVRVYWNSSYRQERGLVHVGQHTAYQLASDKTLKTKLFNLRIIPLDLRKRLLVGARIVLDGVEAEAGNGTALYPLVPEGNHSIQVFWKGVKVLDSWVWSGYHPTIYPWMTRPAVRHELTLPVDDLMVKVVDNDGSPLPARLQVVGPTPETSVESVETPNGTLTISQLPISEYLVKAEHCSEPFGVCVEREASAVPGKPTTLVMPLYSLTVRVEDAYGEPLGGALVKLGPLKAEADESGRAVFPGVPEGGYVVKVYWRGVMVHEGGVDVPLEQPYTARSRVYRLSLSFETSDGRPYYAVYSLIDSSGARIYENATGRGLKTGPIPGGPTRLTILTPDGRVLINDTFEAEHLASLEVLRLPISNMVIKVMWSDGSAAMGSEVLLRDLGLGLTLRGRVDDQGMARFRDVVFGDYSLTITYPRINITAIRENITFTGQVVEKVLRKSSLLIRVLDLLGTPLQGVEVSVEFGGKVLATKATDSDGNAYFILPHLPTYRVIMRYGGEETTLYASPGAVMEHRLEALNLIITSIRLRDLPSILTPIAAVTSLLIALLIIRRLVRRREAE